MFYCPPTIMRVWFLFMSQIYCLWNLNVELSELLRNPRSMRFFPWWEPQDIIINIVVIIMSRHEICTHSSCVFMPPPRRQAGIVRMASYMKRWPPT